MSSALYRLSRPIAKMAFVTCMGFMVGMRSSIQPNTVLFWWVMWVWAWECMAGQGKAGAVNQGQGPGQEEHVSRSKQTASAHTSP